MYFYTDLFSWAENETRTRDPNLGKVMLYQLSYFRKPLTWCPEQDSNLHASRHTHLKRARLPIPPPGQRLLFQHFKETWAENETRTRDPNLGKVMLYQLSYFRIFSFAVAKVGIFRNSANILHLFFTRICTLCFRKQTIVLIINSFGPDSLHKKIACIFPLSLLLSTKRWRDDGFR